MTEQEKEEYRQLIADLTLFSSTIEDLQGKMQSEAGKEFMSNFVEGVMPAVKQMKAMCLVELGDI